MVINKNISPEDESGNRKLDPKFCRSFKITHRIDEVDFRLDFSELMKERKIENSFHASLHRPFILYEPDRTENPPAPLQFDDQHQEFEVEYLFAHRKYRAKSQYLIKWEGYVDYENAWPYTKNLQDC